jgi:hypothetical protein
MTAALKTPEVSEEALSFVRGGATTMAPKPEVPEESRARVVEAEPPAPTTGRMSKPVAKSVAPSLVGLSTRIEAHLHESLMRASFERKLARQEPHTHQDIVTEALTAWLKRNGYPVTPTS